MINGVWLRTALSPALKEITFTFLNPIKITSTWVEREVSDPLQEEGREGLGVGSRGEAKSDWAGHEDGDGGEKI